MDHEYAFDVTLTGALRVTAPDEDTARQRLTTAIYCADANLGAWPNGDPILAEITLTGKPELYEIDGETLDPEDVELPGDGDPDPRDEG